MVRTCPRCFATIINDEAEVCPGCRYPLPAKRRPVHGGKSFEIQAKIQRYKMGEIIAYSLALVCLVTGGVLVVGFSVPLQIKNIGELWIELFLEGIGSMLIIVAFYMAHKKNQLEKMSK